MARILSVAYDVTPLLGNRTGIGVLAAELLDAVTRRHAREVAVTGFAVTTRSRAGLAGRLPAGVALAPLPMPARPLRAAWQRTDLAPIEWWTGRVDVVHATNFVSPPSRHAVEVITLHDLAAWRFPEVVAPASLAYPELVARALRRGAWLHVTSAFVAAEAIAELGADPDRVVQVAPGMVPAPDADPNRGRMLAGGDRFILAVGTIEPRKDYPTLVRAFDAVAADDPDVRLVIAGSAGWGADAFDAAVAAARHRDRIVQLGYVSDDDRASLLRAASVFAFCSVYEGFGFPPLEAMSAGVPVVATRAGAVPEVVGDAAAALVEVGDADALGAGLAAALAGDAAATANLRAKMAAQVAGFSWEECADGIVALWERAQTSRV